MSELTQMELEYLQAHLVEMNPIMRTICQKVVKMAQQGRIAPEILDKGKDMLANIKALRGTLLEGITHNALTLPTRRKLQKQLRTELREFDDFLKAHNITEKDLED